MLLSPLNSHVPIREQQHSSNAESKSRVGGVMKLKVFAVVVALFLSVSGFADDPKKDRSNDVATTPTTTSLWCESPDCAGYDEDQTDTPGGTVGTSGQQEEKCYTATNYATCISKCDCEFRKASKKCRGGLLCNEIATSDREACYGICVTDWN
jgi:hypothetical protein